MITAKKTTGVALAAAAAAMFAVAPMSATAARKGRQMLQRQFLQGHQCLRYRNHQLCRPEFLCRPGLGQAYQDRL